MLEIARVETWTTRAREAAAAMKGRGPAERGLARLHRMGLVRELTGQGRFRLWAV
ncbi:hypothetical protein [Rhodovulum strictum]|uniref:Uncharacterized protein n=1 Tax=Rhodovulum strictum TaxID=58314 RepID=A0A844BMF9_9RHOB|nr:hypothetical protein [Rhodovulum strictum]MRH22133.1 hypothetical protein [Rhodovulum strictum]